MPADKKPDSTADQVDTAASATPKYPAIGRLLAVHGDLVHAFDGTVFTTDASKKHEIDAWCALQLDAEKLKFDEE